MGPWTGIALASSPGAPRLASRLSPYLHPLAGRPLAWHAVHALATLAPRPERVVLVAGPELAPALFADLPVEVAVVPDDAAELAAAGLAAGADVVALDAAASLPAAALQRLLDRDDPRALLEDPLGRPLAARLPHDDARALLAARGDLRRLADVLGAGDRTVEPAGFVVESRAELARAVARVRDRLVAALMEGGTTFLLPDTVLVDVDVRTGRDTVVYPGVVLEGQTTIGDETVVGPGCRIIDSWIGSGVELKGFNYVSHTSVRNRAILEPHVRRGFD